MRRFSQALLMNVVILSIAATVAHAELPPVDTLLGDLGFSPDEIASIKGGKIATLSPAGAHERDLAAGFAFFVQLSPAELAKTLKAGLLNDVDENTIASQTISATGTLDDFAKLALKPETESRVKRYVSAAGGEDLNLSTDEIAAFNKLGATAAPAAVESQLRQSLLARYQAYRAKGLAGIAPYDRGKGKARSAADDLRAALESSKMLKKYAPQAYTAMMNYPSAKPSGADELFRWTQLSAHDVPTIVLVHGMYVPDGDALLVLQRQFYVSEGFNCEQAVAGFLPVEGGTVVLYVNHTSTDQVTGFGGGAKRSIGSKLMSSQLQGLFGKLQKKAP
jgi:hypothetical protein